MKISINSQYVDSPWGGGNLFIKNIYEYLVDKGHKVSFDLKDKNLDIILIINPRQFSTNTSYSYKRIAKYKLKNNNVKVVHRINECDERKNTDYVNNFILKSNTVADFSIFVSEWLFKIYIERGFNKDKGSVIMSGSDNNIFNNINLKTWSLDSTLKIVTHHWGTHQNKGFEVYKKLDQMLNENNWKNKISFTFIGNLPKNFKFNNSKKIEPLSGLALAKELKNHNLYITGSLFEPSGNHHIEAAECGLPVMQINSGGTTEYLEKYGLEYDLNNLPEKIEEMINKYEYYFELMTNYPFNSNKMCAEYENLFKSLIK